MIKNEKGNALVLAILAFAVIMIFAMTMMFVGESSFKHADKEKNKTQAYYVAKTGADSVIKYLNDKGNEGDMRDELEELIRRTDAKEFGEGKYKDGDFEIKVKKSTRKDEDGNDKAVYLVESTGEIKDKINKGKDQITAVLTPDYEVNYTWGTGTVDAGEEIFVKGLHNLEGNGIILNASGTKGLNSPTSPIEIQEGYSTGHEIMGLFNGNSDGKDNILGYSLKRTKVDSTNIISETLEYDNLPAGSKPVSLNYGVERKKPDINVPKVSGSNIDLKDKIIDVNSSSPIVGKFVNESYDVVEFDKNADPVKETKDKRILKIEADRLQFFGSNEIKTSRNTDVVIYTNIFSLMEHSKLNITGPGRVYIYVNEKMDLINNSDLGVDLNVKLEDRAVNMNIHIYMGGNDGQIGNHTNVSNTYIYGKKPVIQLAGNSIFTGRISATKVQFRDNMTLRSPAPDDPHEDHDPIIGFKKIEWQR